MLRTTFSIAALALSVSTAAAQEPLKIGLIQSMTGPFNTVGKAVVNGARLYMLQHGDIVAGRKIVHHAIAYLEQTEPGVAATPH